MSKLLIIGDVHGKVNTYQRLIESSLIEDSIKVGDMGCGFPEVNVPIFKTGNHKFIRGNHDNPTTCRLHPDYLGDYGYDVSKNLFYAGGAYSTDKETRTEGIDWWADEELSETVWSDAIDLYVKSRPNIMVTHDCPSFLYNDLFGINRKSEITTSALQVAYTLHKPDIWIFGHHHRNKDVIIYDTRFVCLAELSTLIIDV